MSNAPRIYFLGIGGTLMGNLAILAKQAGYSVSGYDGKIYPPMSDQLANAAVTAHDHFEPSHLTPRPETVVVGNASMPRGTPALEFVLANSIPYQSGAEWLGQTILRSRHVIAISGTHGKTTTTAMVAWILHCAGKQPGYLIGGAAQNFNQSAELGRGHHFVIEADEYDTSYFDRRSKFRHYRPRTLTIGNLEFDHADIFEALEQIKYQFHHLIREIPSNGRIVVPAHHKEIQELLERGCWTPVANFRIDAQTSVECDGDYSATCISDDGREFDVFEGKHKLGSVNWSLIGSHNVSNAMCAILAAEHAGVDPEESIGYLSEFKGVRRRMETIAEGGNTIIYSDFAHHPTAIRTTLEALRSHVGTQSIIAVIEPRTHTMSLGTYRDALKECCLAADEVHWYRNNSIKWNLDELASDSAIPTTIHSNIDELVEFICRPKPTKTHVVIMSNGGFDGIFRLVDDQIQQG